jgi:hypothetical protein
LVEPKLDHARRAVAQRESTRFVSGFGRSSGADQAARNVD